MLEFIDQPRAVGQKRRRAWQERWVPRFAAALGAVAAALAVSIGTAAADKIKYPIAVFSGLDKITGRIITFEIATNETVQFGSLQITERVCYSRPPTEAPRTDTFISVDNIDANHDYKRIFTGWMFAGSPSLHALDHPVYDIWLLHCKGAGELIPSPPETAAVEVPEAPLPGSRQIPEEAPQAQPKHPSHQEVQRALPPAGRGPIEVGPPPGFIPPAERRMPARRFYPTTPPPNGNDGF